jgi:hypothetical protein
MASLVARISASYDPQFVLPTSTSDALELLARLRARIEAMGEIERFPEGAVGVVIHALVAERAHCCPDGGDFAHEIRGVLAITSAAGAVVREDVFER